MADAGLPSGLRAVLWDVDGTLAETERDGHRVAFNLAFAEAGRPWRWDEAHYGGLLQVAGGRERILADMHSRGDAPTSPSEREALARHLHARKNSFYAGLVGDGRLTLREGVRALLEQCRARGVAMGIATTTSRANVAALLDAQLGGRWADWFEVLVCGEDVEAKKPDPEVYLRALQALALGPLEVVAVEDSPNGVTAARRAGIPVILTHSAYFAAVPVEGAAATGPGLHSRRQWTPPPCAEADRDGPVDLDDIADWWSRSMLAFRRS